MNKKGIKEHGITVKDAYRQGENTIHNINVEEAASERVIHGIETVTKLREEKIRYPIHVALVFEPSVISVSMVDSDIVLADAVEPRARELEEIVFLGPREVDIAGDAVTSIELGVGPAGLRAILAGNVVFQPADGIVIDREIDVSLPEWPGEEPLKVYSVSTLFRSAREIRAVSFS